MDSYLESLVKKGEEIVETAEPEVAEYAEIDVADEAVENDTADGELTSDTVEDAEPDESPSEVDDQPSEEVKETTEEPEEAKEPEIQEIIKEQEKREEKPVPKSAVNAANRIGATLGVKDIKVFNVPDEKSIFKVFSGNVVVKDNIAGFSQIEYVKPGFGLVKGYTKEI